MKTYCRTCETWTQSGVECTAAMDWRHETFSTTALLASKLAQLINWSNREDDTILRPDQKMTYAECAMFDSATSLLQETGYGGAIS